MSAIQGFMQILLSIWDGFFGLTSPFWGLTFKQIFIGFFIVIISIRILYDMLGLGAAVVDNASNLAGRAVRSHRTSEYRNAMKK